MNYEDTQTNNIIASTDDDEESFPLTKRSPLSLQTDVTGEGQVLSEIHDEGEVYIIVNICISRPLVS